MIEFLIYPLIGIVAGFLAGFFGVGGGLVIVPSLHFLYTRMGYSDEISIPLSLGTALACIVINSLSAISVHLKNKTILWESFLKIFFGLVIGSLFGALISTNADKEVFKKVFALFIFLVSMRMFFKIKDSEKEAQINIFIAAPYGAVVGLTSTMFAVGGGIFVGPFLRLMGKKMKNAVATSVALTLPVGIFGSISYILLGLEAKDLPDYSFGYVNYLSLFAIAIFSGFASRFGAKMTQKVDDKIFQRLYAFQLVPIFIYWVLA